MNPFRGISLPAHGALELMIGLATLLAPFALGFAPAGLVVGALLGALIMGNSLATVDGGAKSVLAHRAWDRFAVGALVVAALLVGLTGDRAATGYFAAAALAQAALSASTRYAPAR